MNTATATTTQTTLFSKSFNDLKAEYEAKIARLEKESDLFFLLESVVQKWNREAATIRTYAECAAVNTEKVFFYYEDRKGIKLCIDKSARQQFESLLSCHGFYKMNTVYHYPSEECLFGHSKYANNLFHVVFN